MNWELIWLVSIVCSWVIFAFAMGGVIKAIDALKKDKE